MFDSLNLIAIFFIGLVAGFVGNIAAGVSLITVPGLLLLGVPPQIALASSKFGNLGATIGSFIKFFKRKIYIKDLIIPMSIMGIIGAAIGARLLVELNQDFLSKTIGIILLVLLPLLFLKKNVGIVRQEISRAKRRFAHVLYFLVKVWNGFFPPGSGFLASYVLLNAYGLTLLEAKGTSKLPNMLSTLSAVIVFAFAGIIDYKIGGVLFVGMLIGGYVGAHVAIKKGDAWIKPIMAVFIVIVALKLIFF